MKRIRYIYGWLCVRPRRWFFLKMVMAAYPRWLPERLYETGSVKWPNIHWHVLYLTVFRFFKWLQWDAWRGFCTWDRHLKHKPWYAAWIQRIGETTAGAVISGGECWHCGHKGGNPIDLTDDETGTTFKFERTWMVGTQEGNDYRFCGTTICPHCGYKDYYEDGSL